jgi:hypothetical protein
MPHTSPAGFYIRPTTSLQRERTCQFREEREPSHQQSPVCLPVAATVPQLDAVLDVRVAHAADL